VGRKESTGFIEKLAKTFSKNFQTMDLASMFNLVKELMSDSDIEVCHKGTIDGTGVFLSGNLPSFGESD
jgi:hypothetical protein